MRVLLALLQESVARLERRSQRLLLLSCTAVMVVFAGTTVTAAQAGEYAEMAAGAVMLGAMTTVCATIWAVRRGNGSR